jgi:hypothetical protein
MSKRDEDSLYTVTYAAKLLGLTKNGGYEAAKRGDIPTIKIGRLISRPLRSRIERERTGKRMR